MKKNKFIITLMCLLSSCGGNVISNTDLSSSSDIVDVYKGDIVVALPGSSSISNIINNALIEYKKIRPDVNVSIDYNNGDLYSSYVQSLNNGVGYPDACYIDHVYISTLANNNKIVDVTDSINEIKDKYVYNLINANSFNNKYYGYPFSANTVCLFYNKDIVKDREIPTTYEKFLQVGQSIYDQESTKPLEKQAKVFSLSVGTDSKDFGTFLFTSWLARENGSYLSDDLKTSLFSSIEMKNALSKWKQIVDLSYAYSDISAESNFYSGKVAFIEMGCWKIPDLIYDTSLGNFGVAPLFSLNESGNNSSVLGLYSLCVTKQNDQNKVKISKDFCAFLSTHLDTQIAYAKDCKCLPVTKNACNDSYYQKEEWKIFIDAMSNAAIRPVTPIWPNIKEETANMYMKVLQNRASIDDALTYVNNKIQNALNAYNK